MEKKKYLQKAAQFRSFPQRAHIMFALKVWEMAQRYESNKISKFAGDCYKLQMQNLTGQQNFDISFHVNCYH